VKVAQNFSLNNFVFDAISLKRKFAEIHSPSYPKSEFFLQILQTDNYKVSDTE